MSTNKTFNKVQLDVKFTQATTRANLISEENISISFGKISKYFADLHSQAFTGYTHPTYTAHSSGLYKITVDSKGHVSEATAVAKADITTLGIPGQDTTYSAGNHLTLSGTTFKVADYCKNINGGDWNTVTTNGWYMGAECTNAPSTAWWIGHVHAHNNKYCIQEVWQFTASTDGHKVPHKMRMFVNNVWGNWVDVTVGTQVPENAVFTDTKVTSSANHYTPATVSGQDKSASASGATAAWSIDVVKGITLNTDGKGHVTGLSVTSGRIHDNPVPSNNVTGSGTSGYLTKWNGAHTITNGPQLGSSTTTYLRNDGSWATPTNTNTTYTIGTSGNNVTLTPSSGSVQSITVPYASNAAQAIKLRSSAARTDSTVDTADTTPYQKYWVKIASCYTTGNWTDLESLWAVNDVYGNRQGILKVRARVEGTAGTFGNTRTIRWIVADSDIDVNRFAIVCYNNRKPDGTEASGTATVELWWKSTYQYASFSFVLLDETRRTGKQPNDWVLYDTSTYGQAALPTTGNITYSVAATILNSTTGTSSNVTGTVAIAHGGTGATNRLAALRALTEQDVGTNAQYFLTITNSWGQGGYTSVANAKTVLGLKSAAYTESSDYVPNTQDGMNAAINLLSTGSSNPGLADYYVSQYANGGTTTKSYHRRPISALWNTFKGLITLTTTGSGNAVTDVSIANDGDHNRKITVTKGSTFSLSTHTHNYAGSSSAGGAATSANKLTTARTITLRNEFQGSASFDGSANITISGSHYRVQCGGQNTTNYPWHRIAYCSGKTGNYSDTDAIIDVWKGYDSGSYGRIKISLRTNNAGAACSASAKWIYRYGFAADDIKIARWGVTGDSVYADVFLKCGQYPRAYIVQIHGNRAWTLVASSEAKDTTSSDKKDSVEVYKTIEAAATELHNQAYTEIKSCEDVAYTRGVAIPRAGSSNDANSFPGKNLVTFTEWPGTSTNNTPTANFYHILRAQGDDTRYGTQLALGMTTNAVYYRNYNNQTWIDWQPLGRFTTTPTSGQVVITDGTTGGIKSSGYTIAKSVPSNAVFTDHITTVTSSGSGNAVTAISADANGALTVTKGSTFSLSTHTHSYAGSSSPGGPANSATRADFVNVVASNEIRFYNDNQFKANNHFWLGYSWAAGSHYTPSGGSDTSSTTAPNITEFVMGNCSQGGLASVHAKTFILGNGSSPTKSSKTTTITTAATTTDRTITLPDDSGTVALTSKTFNVTRGSSVSTATTGFWAAMCNSTQTGSPVLPTSGKWWHVISMDWSGNDIKNWISQLAIATQDGSGVWWRRNDTGGTSINSFSWHRLAEGNSSGAATNIATEVGNSAGARPVFFAYLGDNTRVVYNTNFTYNPSTGTITANKFAGNITSDGLNAGIYELLNTDNPVFNGAEWMLTSIPSSSGGTSEPSFRRVKTAKFADYVNSISRDVLFNDSTNTSKSITLSNPPTDTQYLKLYFKSSGNMGQTTMDNSVYSIAEVPYMTDVNLGGILQVAQPSDNTGVLKSTVLAFTIRITNHTLTLTKAPYPSRLDGSAVANDTHLSANIIKVVAYR